MGADIRHAVRGLVTQPGVALAAMLTLALAIGAATAIFSVVDGVLLRAAPAAHLDRLVVVWETDRHTGTVREPASIPDAIDFRRDAWSLSALEGVIGAEAVLQPARGEPVRLAALHVTPGLLPAFGLGPLAGRGLTAGDVEPGAAPVVLISESLWARAFGRAAGVIGQTLRLDDQPRTIAGVMPDGSDFGMLQLLSAADYSRGYADRGDRATADVWLPLPLDPVAFPRSTHPVLLVGRLAEGASVEAAATELSRLADGLERAYPENDGRGVHVEPLGAVIFGRVRPVLLALWGAVGLLLVIACANVASLLLARARSRSREVAVRLALGAGTGRMARQFAVEGLALAIPAAACGVALAAITSRALVAMAPPDVPRLDAVTLDLRVLLVAVGLAVATGLVFGLVPLVHLRATTPHQALKGPGAGGSRRAAHGALVAVELALAVVLVSGAALLTRSVWHLLQVDPGFAAEGVLKVEYSLPESRYPVDFRRWPDLSEIHDFTTRLLAKAAALPGVDAVAVSGTHPLDPGFTNSFEVVGREAESASWPELSIRSVTPGYFRATGLALVSGRLLADTDTTRGAPVVVINQAAAARFFDGRDPIGARIRFWGTARTIVGVVANEKFKGLTAPDPLVAYAPFSQAPARGGGVLLARVQADPGSMAGSVAAVVREVDPQLAVFGVEPLAQTVGRSIGRQRFALVLLATFAAMAVALAVIGVHGVLGYLVAERRRELGIRAALGAGRGRIARLVVTEGLGMALVGIGAGMAAALASSRALASLLYGVTPTDLPTLAGTAAALTLVAAAATALPARRAGRVDPAALLRE